MRTSPRPVGTRIPTDRYMSLRDPVAGTSTPIMRMGEECEEACGECLCMQVSIYMGAPNGSVYAIGWF